MSVSGLLPRLPRSCRTLIVGTLAVSLAVLLVAVLLLAHLHGQALREGGRQLQHLAAVQAEQVEQTIEAVELVQDAVLERVMARPPHTPAEYRQSMSGLAVHHDLVGRVHALPQLDALTAIDAEGKLINFSRGWPIPDISVADRDYYNALRDHAEMRTMLSLPVQNRGSGSWTIYVARRVSNEEGGFLGLVLGAMQMSYFERWFEQGRPGDGGAVALLNGQGTLLARYPHADAAIGVSFHGSTLFDGLRAAGGVAHLVLRQTSNADGSDRLLAAQKLARHDLVLVESADMGSVLAEYHRQALAVIIGAGIFELVLAAMGLLMLRQVAAQSMLEIERTARTTAEAALTIAQERARADLALEQQNARFSAALRSMSQALCMCDGQDRLVVANHRLVEMLGLPPMARLQGESLDLLLGLGGPDGWLAPQDIEPLRVQIEAAKQRGQRCGRVIELRPELALSMQFAPMEDGGWLATFEDITARRQVEARIAHMAHHDALTGLPNRVLFHERLAEAIALARCGRPAAVLCLDLDHFKSVNDTLGHHIGDELLRAVTQRLRGQLREGDLVARLGGDEFAFVQAGADATEAAAMAQRIIDVVSAPYEVAGHQIIIGASIGIARVPQDGEDGDTLLKNADLALYQAKGEGRGRHRLFEPVMGTTVQERRALEMDLRNALAHGELRMFYQPLINVQTRAVSGFEALLRWEHPSRGMVSPADFVPLAEEIGLIVPIGAWALRQACHVAVGWPADVKVAVNLSAVQFVRANLIEMVDEALRSSGLRPDRLELEITETVMLEETDATLATLQGLHGLGVRIAMDDFGTGYSSLSYLRSFPFDKVKIDKSFVDGLGQGGDCDAIVGAVLELCGKMGMTTTAEGVETADQMRRLVRRNCTEVQGYLFSQARPAHEVAALCRILGPEPAAA